MITNRWGGERISLAKDTSVALIQTHLSRYVWSLFFCAGKSVLDVGCGTGYGTWLISTVASDVLGLDCCAEAIQEAKQTFGEPFICTAIEEANLNKQFDVVVCFEVLEHLTNLDIGMECLKQHMKADGVALVSLPLHQPSEFHHKRDFGCEQWKALLEQHFQIVGVHYQFIESNDPLDNNVSIRVAEDAGTDLWYWRRDVGLVFEPEKGIVLFILKKNDKVDIL